jgi:hypothetical protein
MDLSLLVLFAMSSDERLPRTPDHSTNPESGREISLRASMRPTVHDYGFSVVSPPTDEAHLVE